MKKICFLLTCLAFISALPTFAQKIIINDNNDRIVYSRSSFSIDDTKYDVDQPKINEQVVESNEAVLEQKEEVSKSDEPVIKIKYDRFLMELLAADFRKELAGTKWYYPQEEIVKETISAVEENAEKVVQEIDNIENKKEIVISKHQTMLERLKRDSREAADYYMIDLGKDPENLVPSGIYQ